MSLVTVALRRIRPHLATWLAVLASVLVTATTVGALTLLSGAIGEASTRGLIAAAEPTARSIAITTSLAPGEWAEADAAVESVLGPVDAPGLRTVAASTTSRGIEGRPETARALLAEVRDVADHADLVAGEWPEAVESDLTDTPGAALDVALHDGAAEALGVGVGSTLGLIDLLDEDAGTQPVRIVGTYLPREPADAVWAELPIAAQGTTATEFESYGPFLLGPGAFDHAAARSATVTWRVTPQVTGTDAGSMASLTSDVERALEAARAAATRDEPGAVPVLRGAQAGSGLPALLDEAAELATRARSAVLTPTFLLLLLGGTALAVSVALLALLREPETRLLRTRGAGTSQIARMALLEGILIVGLAAAGGLLLAPTLATLVASRAGLATGTLTLAASVRDGRLLALLAVVAALAVVTIVVTSILRSRDTPRGTVRPGLARVLAGTGLDLVLLALGVLAFLQLRRYLDDPAPALDPVTAAAPGLLVAALAVALLRVLPVLATVVGRVAETRSLPVAWGGWQVARRIGTQAGALLLILLAVPIGILAVSQQSTTARAIEDQSRFAVGADLRVEPRPDSVRAPDLVARLATAAGGREHVMPAARETMTLGSLERVTVLGVDASTAGTVAQPRPDLVPDATWPDLMARLAQARPDTSAGIGIPLPDSATSASVTLDLDLRGGEVVLGPEEREATGTGVVVVTDGDGQTWSTSLGQVSSGEAVEIALPEALPRPLSITSIQLTTGLAGFSGEEGPILGFDLARLTADGAEVPTDALEPAVTREGAATMAALRPAVPPPPVVLTAAVASDLEVVPGDLMTLPTRGQSLDVEVVGVIEALPTAVVPDRGVVADLATLDAAALAAGGERVLVGTAPREFWLDPEGGPASEATQATEDALRADPAAASRIHSAESVAAERRGSPVHAGLRAALLLVGVAAILLAALGFAATTAAIGRTRRHESAVLHALGLAPGQIRRTVLIERWAVIALAVAAGVVVGVIVTYAVVPLLVGGDGYPLVPDVLPVVPWAAVGLVAAVTAAALVAGTLVAARQVTSELSASLREGAER